MEDHIEELKSDENDFYSDDSLFNIQSWGADLSFRELVSMYDDNELVKPELQRKYVWDRNEASRFIESILLGLPVPSIFLAQKGSQKLIVDGYQRIMTVYDYMKKGKFSADGKPFRLSNSENINSRWRNKLFEDLTVDEQRKIRSTTIHAIIFTQKKPENDDTSMYQIFERINTSGRTLTPQEIRNCVYQGSLNTLLFNLNSNSVWRTLYGSADEDSRMRDVEYILRFFTIKELDVLHSDLNQISLKKELNKYMGKHCEDSNYEIDRLQDIFIGTVSSVYDSIGANAFKNYTGHKYSNKFHPAIYDAIMLGALLAKERYGSFSSVSEEKHLKLLENEEFKNLISYRTTNISNIRKRVDMVTTSFWDFSINDSRS